MREQLSGHEIWYGGPETGGVLKLYVETSDGSRFTPEQWQLMQFMERLEEKLDALTIALSHRER